MLECDGDESKKKERVREKDLFESFNEEGISLICPRFQFAVLQGTQLHRDKRNMAKREDNID